MHQLEKKELAIFFFDSSCGICSRFVRFVHRIDSKNKIYFAPIGGDAFQAAHGSDSFVGATARDSSYFHDGKTIWAGAQGIFRVIKVANSGLGFGLTALYWILPDCMIERIYDFIASNRSRIMPNKACNVPSIALRKKLLR